MKTVKGGETMKLKDLLNVFDHNSAINIWSIDKDGTASSCTGVISSNGVIAHDKLNSEIAWIEYDNNVMDIGIKNMKEYKYQENIYMTGSHIHVKRNIYEQNGLYYITWYGNKIQVEHTDFGTWQTVEQY